MEEIINSIIFKQIYIKKFFSTSAVVLNKQIIKNFYFNEKLPNAQDYDFWLKISKNIKDHTIKKVLGYYVQRNNNITSRSYLKKIACFNLYFYKIYEL